MEEFQVLYTKVILRSDMEMDLSNMREREVRLEFSTGGGGVTVLGNVTLMGLSGGGGSGFSSHSCLDS